LEQEKLDTLKDVEKTREMLDKYNQKLLKVKEQQKKYQGIV
jgi:hypothetical protein